MEKCKTMKSSRFSYFFFCYGFLAPDIFLFIIYFFMVALKQRAIEFSFYDRTCIHQHALELFFFLFSFICMDVVICPF